MRKKLVIASLAAWYFLLTLPNAQGAEKAATPAVPGELRPSNQGTHIF